MPSVTTAEEVAQRALLYLRVDGVTITDVTSSSGGKFQGLVNAYYDAAVCGVLSEQDWNFARKYALLALNTEGLGEAWEDHWTRAFDAPADLVAGRGFLLPCGSRWRPEPQLPWAIGVLGSDRVIFADVDEADANFAYTAEITAPALWSEPFADAVAVMLAAKIAGPANESARVQRDLIERYRFALGRARAFDAQQFHAGVQPDTDHPFLRARE